MKIQNRDFTQQQLQDFSQVNRAISERYGLKPVRNTYLIFDKLQKTKHLSGHYVECGTFTGKTLLPVAEYCINKDIYTDRKLFGIDTFEGFPAKETHPKDAPDYFKTLYQEGKITSDHFEKARIRTNDFKYIGHLTNEYFYDVADLFVNIKNYNNIELLKGTFEEITPRFTKPIAVLHLDGDLYESYLTCLKNLYSNIISGGAIIFDEYYSHKYPGARAAIDEFFNTRKSEGYMEKVVTEEGHERWCFNKF